MRFCLDFCQRRVVGKTDHFVRNKTGTRYSAISRGRKKYHEQKPKAFWPEFDMLSTNQLLIFTGVFWVTLGPAWCVCFPIFGAESGNFRQLQGFSLSQLSPALLLTVFNLIYRPDASMISVAANVLVLFISLATHMPSQHTGNNL